MTVLKTIIIILFPLLVGCETDIIGSLRAEDVSEGPCLSVTELWPHLYHEVNTVPVIVPGDYYVPMASQALYRHYAEGLLGRPAKNEFELEAMQLSMRCGPLFSTIDNKGYPYQENPPHFGQVCLFGGVPNIPNLGISFGHLNIDYVQAVCIGLPAIRPDGDMAWRASPSFVATMDSIIWANEDSSVLLAYRCPYDGIKDFKVVSKNKTLSADVIEILREKVIKLGFREDYIAFQKYD
ncbi:hypothetical protein Ocin01_14365 [Orchesella cincta]|uniref:Uncharacterized protein n=1 Tax=Orchesella cincta TaxID=48709 RepID=A0A1D2MH39_ORCCI|nr:hypothetical protein Ocin01_14365 [Orchesella cincta]